MQKRVGTFENDQKNQLFWSHSFVLAYRILASEIIIFWLFLYLKESLVATFSENCAHTSRKYLTEQGMGVVKWSENHKFIWLHSYIFILKFYPQKLQTMKLSLAIEEFLVTSFCKSRALIPRKYMVEQGIRVSNWSELFKSLWSHSFFFYLGQDNLSVSGKFGMIIRFSATFVLDVSAQVSFRVATKGLFKR